MCVKVINIDKIVCSELRFVMLCMWWHHPSGGGVVESAGYVVFFKVLWHCLLCPQ